MQRWKEKVHRKIKIKRETAGISQSTPTENIKSEYIQYVWTAPTALSMIPGQDFLKSSTFDFIQIPLKHRHCLSNSKPKEIREGRTNLGAPVPQQVKTLKYGILFSASAYANIRLLKHCAINGHGGLSSFSLNWKKLAWS